MCCFCLHFFDFNVSFFSKKLKNLLQFTFEKKTCCAKREKKITCREEKSQPPPPPPPPEYQMVRPLPNEREEVALADMRQSFISGM